MRLKTDLLSWRKLHSYLRKSVSVHLSGPDKDGWCEIINKDGRSFGFINPSIIEW